MKLMVGDYIFGASLDIVVSNFRLEGSGPGTVISGNIAVPYIIVGDGGTALSNVDICDLQIDGSSQTNGSGISLDGGGVGFRVNDCVISRCIIHDCFDEGIYDEASDIAHGNSCLYCIIADNGGMGLRGFDHNGLIGFNTIRDNGGYGMYVGTCRVIGNHLFGNVDWQIYTIGNRCVIVGNAAIDGLEAPGLNASGILAGGTQNLVVGNRCTNNQIGLQIGGDFSTATGNISEINKEQGMRVTSDYITISGNMLQDNCKAAGVSKIELDITNSDHCIITNNIIVRTINDADYGIVEGGTSHQNIIKDNIISGMQLGAVVYASELTTIRENENTPVTQQRHLTTMKNNTGGDLVAGDTVIFESVAAGDEVATTVNQGDDKVFGMLAENINNGNEGLVLMEGKTEILKVDGTNDISIGDFLCTFTVAGIAAKAGAADMAFAIALEAYTGDDSNGVIDALLIVPRKI